MKNNRIWLTGASRGIGLATAKKLADNDITLFLSARTENSFKNVIKYFSSYQNVFLLPCDVSNSDEVNRTVKRIDEISGGIDILINNAGVGIFKDYRDTTEADFNRTIDVNLKGPFLCSKAVLPFMFEQEDGIIINILSVAATSVFQGTSIYSASKAGLLAMDRILRNEVRGKNIKIVDILPGATDSAMWDEESRTKFKDKMMQPEDVADVIVNTIELNLKGKLLTEEVLIRPIGGDL